ncbi:MAG: BatA domain-containing protein, partial [Verrucomicrobiota bacterium]
MNSALVFGLLAVSIPIIIHFLTRQTGRTVDWGAIQFLIDSMVIRNRRIRLEEALLMAARCLLLALLALALARPFIPPGVSVPWFFVLPLFFIAAVCLGVAVVLWDVKLWRWILLAAAVASILSTIILIRFEHVFNLSRFSSGGRQDVALILDASTSMALEMGGQSNFERARREAETIVKRSPRGNSFSLILGGPTPSARMLVPTTDREAVLEHLEALEVSGPLEGGMAAYDCLTLASLGLAQGNNPAKQIIVLTDGQEVGWETNKPARWNFLKEAFANLPSEPQVIVRQLQLPTNFRNLSLADVSYSREIVGVDRPVKISVTVENTGTEAVSPQQVELTVGGQKLTDNTLGQLLPGTKETIEFTHHFESSGAQEVRAKVVVTDEIAQDDEASSAINVAKELKVLLVDGNPGGRFFDRAASFAGLALAPSPVQDDSTNSAAAEDGGMRFLVDPEILPAIELATTPDFASYDAVVLADVPRLPRTAAQELEGFMQQGGGVLVSVGQRSDDEFYNTWVGQDGQQMLPARLVEAQVPTGSDEDVITPSLDTFRHPAVRLISNRLESDFESGSFSHYWRLEETGDAVVGGRLNNGDAYLVSRKVGLGNLVMLGSSLDLRAGNLPSRQSFVPFIHELVYFLADPSAYDLNLDPRWELALHLSGDEHAFAGHGLKGEYFRTRNDRDPAVERMDPSINFNWRGGAPASG